MPNRPTNGRTAPKGTSAQPVTRPEPKPAPINDNPKKLSEYDNGVSRNANRYPRNQER